VAFAIELYLQSNFIKSHPLSFTVIDQAGPVIERRQYKGGSELITQQWIRIQYDSTKAIHDFALENPFAAKSFELNGNYTWGAPLMRNYDDARYEYPWYISAECAVATVILSMFSLIVFLIGTTVFRN
jgi:hypothetical protein